MTRIAATGVENDEIEDLFLMKYSEIPFILTALYLYFVKFAGPRWMKEKNPYNLKHWIRIYNIIQICINFYIIFLPFMDPNILGEYWIYHCKPSVKVSDNAQYGQAVFLTYVYLWVKILDLMDTVFMVLKKKYSQVTFLHLIHHSTMVVMSTTALKEKEKVLFPVVIVNSFIHVLMYTYYFLSSFQRFRSLLWWKSHVTKLQISQFVFILGFMMYATVNNCGFGTKMKIASFSLVTLFLYMFSKFYITTYIIKEKKK